MAEIFLSCTDQVAHPEGVASLGGGGTSPEYLIFPPTQVQMCLGEGCLLLWEAAWMHIRGDECFEAHRLDVPLL